MSSYIQPQEECRQGNLLNGLKDANVQLNIRDNFANSVLTDSFIWKMAVPLPPASPANVMIMLILAIPNQANVIANITPMDTNVTFVPEDFLATPWPVLHKIVSHVLVQRADRAWKFQATSKVPNVQNVQKAEWASVVRNVRMVTLGIPWASLDLSGRVRNANVMATWTKMPSVIVTIRPASVSDA